MLFDFGCFKMVISGGVECKPKTRWSGKAGCQPHNAEQYWISLMEIGRCKFKLNMVMVINTYIKAHLRRSVSSWNGSEDDNDEHVRHTV